MKAFLQDLVNQLSKAGVQIVGIATLTQRCNDASDWHEEFFKLVRAGRRFGVIFHAPTVDKEALQRVLSYFDFTEEQQGPIIANIRPGGFAKAVSLLAQRGADKAALARKALANAKAEIDATLADPAASFWLKEQLPVLMNRDPLDAAADAERLGFLIQEWSIGNMLVASAT